MDVAVLWAPETKILGSSYSGSARNLGGGALIGPPSWAPEGGAVIWARANQRARGSYLGGGVYNSKTGTGQKLGLGALSRASFLMPKIFRI